MKEHLEEILSAINKNRLRTILTGFSIAWGIFMLIILLGSANGLENGLQTQLGDRLVNSLSIRGGYTTKAYKGYNQWRNINLTQEDVKIISDEFPEIDDIALQKSFYNKQLLYKGLFLTSYVEANTTTIFDINGLKLTKGRYINKLDIEESRKVIVIDKRAKKLFFPDSESIGKLVNLDGIIYTVIGELDMISRGNSTICHIPFSTGITLYSPIDVNDGVSMLCTTNGIETIADCKDLEWRIKKRLAVEHNYDPEDNNAVWIWSKMESYKQMNMIFTGIAIFFWLIGIGTLIAGVVGVGNIMLVTVRERTFEFGIRKALGAKPASIVRLILTEAMMITAFFGYLGMVLGVMTMEIVNIYLKNNVEKGSIQMFENPTLDLSITVSATIVLIIAGLIAGYIPARRAAHLKTIDALRFNR